MDRSLAIYPTAHKVEDVLRRASATACAWDHRVFTFPQLVRRLWRECRDGRAALEAPGERLIVEEALRAAPDLGLRPVPGLIDHLHGLIRQFKSAALRPADLGDAMSALGNPGRLSAVVAIFGAYEAALARHRLADAHDRESAVLRMLHEAERTGIRPAPLDGIARLTVAEIYDFSLLQFMIVTSLTRLIGDAVVTIQASGRSVDATRFADLTWNRFVAEESIADQMLPDFVRRDGRPGALGFVLEHLFAAPADAPPPPDATLEIVRAPSRLDEVEYVAHEIRRELEKPGGVAPARVAIVARDLAPYADHLRAVFRRCRIPLAVLNTAPLMATPTARLLIDLVRAPLDGYRRADLIAMLRSPHLGFHSPGPAVRLLDELGYIDAGASPLLPALAARRDALSSALAKASSATERNRAAGRRRWFESGAQMLERLTAALAPLGEPASLAEHLKRLDDSLAALRFDPARGDGPNDAARAWGGVRAILDELAALADRGLGAGEIQPADFARLLETAMTAAPDPDDEGDAGGVRAMPVLDARGLDFDLVFVIGLDDGTFPVYHGDDPILTDPARRQLNPALRDILRRRFGPHAPSALGKLLRSRVDRNAEDPFLFFLALSMPARRAVLTYPAAETNPLVRSPFIDEVVRVLGGAESRIVEIPSASFIAESAGCYAREEFLDRAALDRVLEHPEAEVIIERKLLDSIARRSLTERRREAWLALPTREDHADERYRPDETKRADAGRFDGRVAPSDALRRLLLADQPGWSASRLDELGACGFRFFAARILRLRDEDEPDYELSALESGGLMHEVLRRLIEAIDSGPLDEAEAAVGPLLEAIRLEQRAAARDPAFFDLGWETIERVAARAAQYHLRMKRAAPGSEVRPEHEFSFVLRDRSGGPDLTVRGRIDRLELYRRAGRIDRIRVLDYKRARNPQRYDQRANPDRHEFGRIAFQLPVYLMAALEEFRGQLSSALKLEAGYLILRGRELEHTHPVAQDLVDPAIGARAEAADPVADRIIAMVDDAIGGRFDVDPRECSDFCPYRSVCRNFQRRNA